MEVPAIHIVTPCRNAALTINETISSVLSQAGTFTIKYHIQDAKSEDGTLNIIRRWHDIISSHAHPVFCHGIEFSYASESDTGLYDGVKKGFEKIGIEDDDSYMTWLNADDLLMPGAFSTIVTIGRQFPDVDWITGKQCYLSHNNSLIYPSCDMIYPTNLIRKGYCEHRFWTFIQQEGTFWKKHLWDKVGGINTRLKYAGDFELWMKFANETLLWQFNGPLGIFRRRAGQLSENLEIYLSEVDLLVDRENKEKMWLGELRQLSDQYGQDDYTAACIGYDIGQNEYTKFLPEMSSHRLPNNIKLRSRFDRWIHSSGLDEWEGPYPEYDLPRVRWGFGESTALYLTAEYNRSVLLTLCARSILPKQRLSIYVNKKLRARINLDTTDLFQRHEVKLNVAKGLNEIKIKYQRHLRPEIKNKDQRLLAVLYSEINAVFD